MLGISTAPRCGNLTRPYTPSQYRYQPDNSRIIGGYSSFHISSRRHSPAETMNSFPVCVRPRVRTLQERGTQRLRANTNCCETERYAKFVSSIGHVARLKLKFSFRENGNSREFEIPRENFRSVSSRLGEPHVSTEIRLYVSFQGNSFLPFLRFQLAMLVVHFRRGATFLSFSRYLSYLNYIGKVRRNLKTPSVNSVARSIDRSMEKLVNFQFENC